MSRILIIEDDTDINNMMAEALRKAGYESPRRFPERRVFYISRETLLTWLSWI